MFRKTIDNKKLGDYHELQASAWLLEQGYDVYRNVSSVGSADLVALKDLEVLKINVRTAGVYKDLDAYHMQRSTSGLAKMKKEGIVILNAFQGRFAWSISDLQEMLEAGQFDLNKAYIQETHY